MYALREYQHDLVQGIRAAFRRGSRRILAQLPTGGGKTIVASHIIAGALAKEHKAMFLAPRRELITQTRDSFMRNGIHAGIIMAKERASPTLDVQVASFDTLHHRGMRRQRMAMPPAGLVIVDEAHLSLADSRKSIIKHYGDALVIGLTATPAGPDGRGMGEVYDDLVLGWPMQQLVDEAYLVPARYVVPSPWDLSMLRNSGDDFTEESMSNAVDQPQLIGDIVETWQKHANGMSTVVFCVNRAHARHVTDEFKSAGIAAEYVDGETPREERRDIFARVRSRQTTVLVNVFVASYGLDIPILECAQLARPTRNIPYYLQTVGRVVRPVYADGMPQDTREQRLAAFLKQFALVIDHVGAVDACGYVTDVVPWTLDGSVKIRDAKRELQQEKAEPKPVTCIQCRTSFSGRRTCPTCGHAAVLPTQAIPTFEAELEVDDGTSKRKANREYTWDDKVAFMAGLRAIARDNNYDRGWSAHVYRAKFGVWPNDPRVSRVGPRTPSDEVLNYVKSRNIARRKAGAR